MKPNLLESGGPGYTPGPRFPTIPPHRRDPQGPWPCTHGHRLCGGCSHSFQWRPLDLLKMKQADFLASTAHRLTKADSYRNRFLPLWRETHFEVKSFKTPQLRTTFGSWDVAKVRAVVARSTFPSQNVQSTRGSDHFLTIRWQFDVEKVHAVVARSTLEVRCVKNWGFWATFDVLFTSRRT